MDNVVSDATPTQTDASTPISGVGATFRALAAGTSIERRHRTFLHQGGGRRTGLGSTAPAPDAARLAI
jgi:hypothetical protein